MVALQKMKYRNDLFHRGIAHLFGRVCWCMFDTVCCDVLSPACIGPYQVGRLLSLFSVGASLDLPPEMDGYGESPLSSERASALMSQPSLIGATPSPPAEKLKQLRCLNHMFTPTVNMFWNHSA
jgi:hypothetical protein